MIWIPAALFAALFLSWRMAVQQRIRAEMSVNAAALSRFFFGWPIACLILGSYVMIFGKTELPELSMTFWFFAWAAGFVQMLATNLIIISSGHQNLVSGAAYMKTETLIVAVLAWLLLGESLAPLAWVGILVAFFGILMVSIDGGAKGLLRWVKGLKQIAAVTGLSAGFLFALTAIFIKQSANAVGGDDRNYAGLLVLVAVLGFQTIMQGTYVLLREPNQFRAMIIRWRVTAQVGLLAALASAGWFIAYAQAPVALVGIVGQTQILFTLGFGRFYLHEPLKKNEVAGIFLVGGGVIIALLASL